MDEVLDQHRSAMHPHMSLQIQALTKALIDSQADADRAKSALSRLQGATVADMSDAQLAALESEIKRVLCQVTERRSWINSELANDNDSSVPQYPLSLAVMHDPVVAADGHKYPRKDVQQHIQGQQEHREQVLSTKANSESLSHLGLTPNHVQRSTITGVVNASLLLRSESQGCTGRKEVKDTGDFSPPNPQVAKTDKPPRSMSSSKSADASSSCSVTLEPSRSGAAGSLPDDKESFVPQFPLRDVVNALLLDIARRSFF